MKEELNAGDILERIARESDPKKIKAFFRKAILPAAKDDYENARQAVMFCLVDYSRPNNIDRKTRIKVWEDALRPYFQKSPDVKAILKKEAVRKYLRDIDSFLASSITESGEKNLRLIFRRIDRLVSVLVSAGILPQKNADTEKKIEKKEKGCPYCNRLVDRKSSLTVFDTYSGKCYCDEGCWYRHLRRR